MMIWWWMFQLILYLIYYHCCNMRGYSLLGILIVEGINIFRIIYTSLLYTLFFRAAIKLMVCANHDTNMKLGNVGMMVLYDIWNNLRLRATLSASDFVRRNSLLFSYLANWLSDCFKLPRICTYYIYWSVPYIGSKYQRLDVVWGRYLLNSLKRGTRETKRGDMVCGGMCNVQSYSHICQWGASSIVRSVRSGNEEHW